MATKYSDIVTTMRAAVPSIADRFLYGGKMWYIPFFFDASAALVDSGDVLEICNKNLPPQTTAVALKLNHNGTNGLAASSTLAVTDSDDTVLTPDATIPTSVDTNSTYFEYCLKNSDVSGKKIKLTVGGADWSDTVDLYGVLVLVST